MKMKDTTEQSPRGTAFDSSGQRLSGGWEGQQAGSSFSNSSFWKEMGEVRRSGKGRKCRM